MIFFWSMLDFSLLEKLYVGGREAVLRDVLQTYRTRWSCTINFLYFANLAHHRLIEWTPQQAQQSYLDALRAGDFLLADGIALQLFYRWFSPASKGSMPDNLNGTDLNPWLIEQLLKEHTVSLYLYQCYDPPKGKTIAFLQKGIEALQHRFPGLKVVWADQCLFQEKGKDFQWDDLQKTVAWDSADIKIFLHCTGTPFQEIWAHEHRDVLKKLWFLVINAWGTIDFLTWYEQRAPMWVVRARVLETPWRILQHPTKNWKKLLWMFGIFRIVFAYGKFSIKKLLQLTHR